ncbi:MAG: single-stranded-DNA-specific exonuclease RecJ [Rhodobacter sp.]|nr:single-stranded-DNA-specific exonuclease RecJ [Rhodobacter sp.]
MTGFLGVDSSLTGRCWIGPSIERQRLAAAMEQVTGLPPSVCATLARLGVHAREAERYLAPRLRDLMPDPVTLRDMGVAADRLIAAVNRRDRIAILADYDVDGGASAALLISWLRCLDREATLYVPDRLDEGYGPSEPAVKALATGHDLVICVDCGTLAHKPLSAAAGMDVLVLDHHLGDETLPPAVAVVNPNRQDESGELSYLCAAGVVFLLLVEVNRRLRAHGAAEPDLIQLLDLVALATVADVAPLVGVNRAFVRQGLKVMAARQRPGLVALADIAKMDSPPNPYHLGYLIGPRINAGGRVGKADLGARILSTDDPHEAAALAERLDALNSERREIQDRVHAAALEQATLRGMDGPLVWAAGNGWHPGVAGIVASKLQESANRPAIVIGLDGDTGKGSGRSVSGIDLGFAVRRLVSEGLLLKGGGHRMAAGLTIEREKLERAMERLGELLENQGAAEIRRRDLVVDGVLMPGGASLQLIERIEDAGPFGAGAPAPRFVFPSVQVAYARRVGDRHLKLRGEDGSGAALEAIAFGAYDCEIGPALEAHGGTPFHLAGRLEINFWRGRQTPQLRLEDAARAG